MPLSRKRVEIFFLNWKENTNHLNIAFSWHEVALLLQVHFRQVGRRVDAIRLDVVEVNGHRQSQVIGAEEVVVESAGGADLGAELAEDRLHRVEASVQKVFLCLE